MRSPDFEIPEPTSLYTPFITGRGRERFPALRLCGAALLGVVFGVSVGALIGVGIAASPSFAFDSENIAFVGKVAGSFGLFGGFSGAVNWLAR